MTDFKIEIKDGTHLLTDTEFTAKVFYNDAKEQLKQLYKESDPSETTNAMVAKLILHDPTLFMALIQNRIDICKTTQAAISAQQKNEALEAIADSIKIDIIKK